MNHDLLMTAAIIGYVTICLAFWWTLTTKAALVIWAALSISLLLLVKAMP